MDGEIEGSLRRAPLHFAKKAWKSEKANSGPGEDKEKAKGNVDVLLDPNHFGQEEKEERNYPKFEMSRI